MTTITVPLNDDMLKLIESLIDRGVAANKSDVMRKSLQFYAEQQEVEAILRASREPDLEGDLDELAAKIS